MFRTLRGKSTRFWLKTVSSIVEAAIATLVEGGTIGQPREDLAAELGISAPPEESRVVESPVSPRSRCASEDPVSAVGSWVRRAPLRRCDVGVPRTLAGSFMDPPPSSDRRHAVIRSRNRCWRSSARKRIGRRSRFLVRPSSCFRGARTPAVRRCGARWPRGWCRHRARLAHQYPSGLARLVDSPNRCGPRGRDVFSRGDFALSTAWSILGPSRGPRATPALKLSRRGRRDFYRAP